MSDTRSGRRGVAALVEAARGGDPRALARLITLVENDADELPEVAAAFAPYTGSAQVIGLTGAPGVGKSTTTNEVVRALRGRGQKVALLADTTLVLLAPGMGDAIQAVKAGILEVADVFVVNKADRDGADATYRDIQGMIGLAPRGPGEWRPPVVRAVAAKAEGIEDI